MTPLVVSTSDDEGDGKEEGMKHGQAKHDRRRAARASARGRIVILGDGHGRGKIVDLSSTGIRLRLSGPLGLYRLDDRVDLELRFDGARGGWWKMSGRIVRIDRRGEIAVSFDDVPTDFEDWVQAELLAVLEAQGEHGVLLVDPVAVRRREVAVALRASGRRVREAATPLEAIDQLGESRYHPQVIAIADTVPARIANDLRGYVRIEHRDLVLVRMKERSQ
jgi:hypothetical protein